VAATVLRVMERRVMERRVMVRGPRRALRVCWLACIGLAASMPTRTYAIP
jgi:hypothetical protein